jgi:hypothetical protein
LARTAWPGEGALGRRLTAGGDAGTPCTVVGVAANVRTLELGEEPRAAVYFAARQRPPATAALVVRTAAERGAIVPALRSALASVDPELPLSNVRPLGELLDTPAAQPRFSALMVAAFAGSALGLAAIGLYGLLSTWVADRRPELGVRMAIGAERRDVVALVMREGLRAAAAGVAVGLCVAWAASRLLGGLLFGVAPGDPTTYALVCALVAAIAALACYLPARRAARTDPLTALRCE